MPKQEQQSGLLARLGQAFADAANEVKFNEVERGNVELPGGIRGGIAQITRVWFDVYKNGDLTGQPYFMASATVIEPATHKDEQGRTHRVRGQHTRVGPEPLCDTPKRQSRPTLKEHVGWVMNHFKLMGVNTEEFPDDDIGTAMELAAAELSNPENPPTYIKFDTFQFAPDEQNPNPRVNHKWIDGADPSEVSVDVSPDGGVDVAPTANGHAAPPRTPTGPVQRTTMVGKPPTTRVGAAMQATAAKTPTSPPKPPTTSPKPTTAPTRPTPAPTPVPARKPAPTPKAPPAPPPPQVQDDYAANDELDGLAAQADAGDTAAQQELTGRAEALGFTEEQITGAETWTALKDEMIRLGGPQEGDETTGEPTADAWEPAPEQIYLFKPIDPKSKKPAAKPVEVEVVSVNDADRTVQLKNLNNPKLKYSAGWDELINSDQ